MLGDIANRKFYLGRLVSTPGALEALINVGENASEFLRRHAQGDWGELSEDDKRLNEEALNDGGRLMSVYRLRDDTDIWIITEAADDNGQRVATTILLPEEY